MICICQHFGVKLLTLMQILFIKEVYFINQFVHSQIFQMHHNKNICQFQD